MLPSGLTSAELYDVHGAAPERGVLSQAVGHDVSVDAGLHRLSAMTDLEARYVDGPEQVLELSDPDDPSTLLRTTAHVVKAPGFSGSLGPGRHQVYSMERVRDGEVVERLDDID